MHQLIAQTIETVFATPVPTANRRQPGISLWFSSVTQPVHFKRHQEHAHEGKEKDKRQAGPQPGAGPGTSTQSTLSPLPTAGEHCG